MLKAIKAAVLLLSTLFALEASANWFRLPASCFVNSGVSASCQACNYNYRPIFCSFTTNGVTYRGSYFQGFNNTWIYPGNCANGYVYAQNPYIDPLASANATVNCRY